MQASAASEEVLISRPSPTTVNRRLACRITAEEPNRVPQTVQGPYDRHLAVCESYSESEIDEIRGIPSTVFPLGVHQPACSLLNRVLRILAGGNRETEGVKRQPGVFGRGAGMPPVPILAPASIGILLFQQPIFG